jgi:hypothetical protein
MDDASNSNSGNLNSGQPAKKPDGGAFSQQFSHQPVGARVPDRVKEGILSTAVVVLDSPKEFVLDFLQGLTRPFHVASRVIVTPNTLDEMVGALRENLGSYTATFGPPPPLPKPVNPHRPTIQEIYENFKLSDDMLSGAYANSVMIGHTATEFFFDFITGFYPTAAVSSRVFITAPQVPRMLETLHLALQQYQARYGGRGQLPQAGPPGPQRTEPPAQRPEPPAQPEGGSPT